MRNGELKEVPVCYKAFLSLHGISAKRVQTLQKGLKTTGTAPKDMRGKHSSRPNKLSDVDLNSVIEHIGSFKGRKSHYSLKKSQKLYLPEELNIKKMFEMFKEKYPGVKVSYEKYRELFNTKFNTGFGYPRMLTHAAFVISTKCKWKL